MAELSAALSILSTVALIGALVFTGLQVRTANRVRAEQAAVTIIHTTQSEAWPRGLDILFRLPVGATASQVDEIGPEGVRAIRDIGVSLETIGYMVFRKIVDIDFVEDLIGGVTVAWWSRVKSWVDRERERTSRPRHFEWYQWLVERLEERHARTGGEPAPAYKQYAHWK